MRKWQIICGVVVWLCLVGCTTPPPEATATFTMSLATPPTPTSLPTATFAPALPTETPAPSETPEPTETPIPTNTPLPANTPLPPAPSVGVFDGAQSMVYLVEQTDLGPRFPGSEGHLLARDHIVDTLTELGWEAERQKFEYLGFSAENLIGRANVGVGDVIIIGAHYDTRARSDQTFGQEDVPTIGAVDGASGVAVLLELARSLNLEEIPNELWLTFFDVEDNGSNGIEGWDWIAGSEYMATNLTVEPKAMVLVDMIGDADQQIYLEGNSSSPLREELWGIAGELGFSQWIIPELKYTMIDDHVPFLRRGIPAVDFIDFDYDYWHTVEDTPDKASADSLFRVGRVIQVWLEAGR